MKKIIALYLFCLAGSVNAQISWTDSIKNLLASAKEDSTKLRLLSPLITYYTYSGPDSAIMYAQESISIAKKTKYDPYLSTALRGYGGVLSIMGNYSQAIYFELEALKAAERSQDILSIGWCYDYLASTYIEAGDYDHALFYSYKERSLTEPHYKLSHDSSERNDITYLHNITMFSLAIIYDKLNQPDSALKYIQIVNRGDIQQYGEIDSLRQSVLGNIYLKKGNYFNALKYYRGGYKFAVARRLNSDIMSNCSGLAKTFWKTNQSDSSIYYANIVLETNRYARYPRANLDALELLADVYKSQGNNDSTVKYLELILATKDSLFSQQKVIQLQSMTFNEQVRQQDIIEAQQAYQNRIKIYVMIAGLIVLLLVATVLFWSNRQKQKANIKIEKAYEELKSTQAQLIQSEKMASLGELSAGVAHEIQNPLNFVNNFSELNAELIDEMEKEFTAGNKEEGIAIISNIKQNLEKVIHHGKRADAIVKGMLQHSRTSTGQKEPTDISALAAEYLRLSYHGMRAKDKSFNTTMQSHFDETIGKINIIPQDIARALLNLYNNAFYAVAEKSKQQSQNYQPTVSASTKKIGDKIEIKVKDNGMGIPQKVLDKIFQPFFTTKPTGQGTGLGLSLSYDIIKAHGGEIKVETKEGQGTEFIIQLPVI